MKLVFIGPPGVGKGTYATIISEKLGIPKISTGDMCRDEAKSGSELGKKIEEFMKRGELVSDEIILEIFKKRIKQPDYHKGFILDGIPRNLEQVKTLEKITNIDLVVNFILPEDVIIEKIAARRTCKNCGEIYNVAHIKRGDIDMPPLLPEKEGVCDKCGGELYQRKDDNPETVKNRLAVYKEETKPLVDYYREKGLLMDFHVNSSPDKVVPKVIELIEKRVSSHG
ncbi:MAG: adenylate kinase [Candidatus Aenigmatarchaeota archaeon]|nr:MAG: adenylate kinase [Candidatus Aenigmarchaeota archaeon]